MALTISTQIANQEATSAFTYCYLYEPLRINVNESSPSATKMYVDLEVRETNAEGTVVEELLKYVEFDINPGVDISFDLMKVARQHHDAGVFKFAEMDDITNLTGWHSVVSRYKYVFKIYTDVSARTSIKKLPIVGGRMLEQFVGNEAVSAGDALNEFDFYGIDTDELKSRWSNVHIPEAVLVDPTLVDASPTMTKVSPALGLEPCGGWLIWKSRFGGWMYWGFDMKIRNFTHRYEGSLEVGMFESTKDINGLPYIPVDYTGVSNTYSLALKSLGLSQEELLAVAGINASPAVYFMTTGTEKLELFRLSSATTPVSSLANGGDFDVSLQSISKTEMKTK